MMATDGAEHRESTGLVPGPNGGFLKAPWPRGVSGNPKGRPPQKPITDALWALVDHDPTFIPEIVEAVRGMIRNGDSSALREVWGRLEGKIPQGEKKAIPSITLNVSGVPGYPTAEQPAKPDTKEVEVERLPISVDEYQPPESDVMEE